MPQSHSQQFRERFSEFGAGLKQDTNSARRRPSIEGLKLDMSFDISSLSKFGETKDGPPGGGIAGSGLQIDADLGKINEGLDSVRHQDADARVRKILEDAQRWMSNGEFSKALEELERALQINPNSVAALFLQGFCMFQLDEHEAAIEVLTRAFEQAEDPQTVVLILLLQTACKKALVETPVEEIRVLIRRGKHETARRRIESLGNVLANDSRVVSIQAYISERKPRGLFDSLFGRGQSSLDAQTREGLLQWLLAEEIGQGMQALHAEAYDEAMRAFDCAAGIDGRCAMVCFLHAVSIFKAFDAAAERREPIDLRTHRVKLENALKLLQHTVRDDNLRERGTALQHILQGRLQQLEEVSCELTLMKREAKPVNQLVLRFNKLMEGLEKNGISSLADIDRANSEFKQIRAEATRLRRKGGLSKQGQQLVDQLAEAAERHERGIESERATVGKQLELRQCMEQFQGRMETYQKNPISSRRELEKAQKFFRALQDRVRQARAGWDRGSDAEKVLGQLEEAIGKVLAQL